jgi:hypothetical protein
VALPAGPPDRPPKYLTFRSRHLAVRRSCVIGCSDIFIILVNMKHAVRRTRSVDQIVLSFGARNSARERDEARA